MRGIRIIERRASFEVISDDGTIVRHFPFDDNASRRGGYIASGPLWKATIRAHRDEIRQLTA